MFLVFQDGGGLQYEEWVSETKLIIVDAVAPLNYNFISAGKCLESHQQSFIELFKISVVAARLLYDNFLGVLVTFLWSLATV